MPNWQSPVSAARGFTLPESSCSDASLESLVRWTLMQSMDSFCGWPGPVNLACNRMLSPPQLCTDSTAFTGSTANITDGVPDGGYYSASSSCSWTINTPEQPYITLNFSAFDTEPLYDIVTVQVRKPLGVCGVRPTMWLFSGVPEHTTTIVHMRHDSLCGTAISCQVGLRQGSLSLTVAGTPFSRCTCTHRTLTVS